MLYEKMKYRENPGWCKPFITIGAAVVIKDEELAEAVIDGSMLDVNDIDSVLGFLAEAVDADSESLSDILNNMREVGCINCYWRDSCEYMQE